MKDTSGNLPPWRDCDIDWDKAFAEYIAENRTLPFLMLKNARIYSSADVLIQKNINGRWESTTWTEYADKFTAVAKSLIDMGIKKGDMCSVFSGNCSEWAISDMGILATRAVSVPIYATNSREEAEYIINDAGVKVLFAGNQEQYDKALQIIAKNKHLEYIVAMQDNIKIKGKQSVSLNQMIEKREISFKR